MQKMGTHKKKQAFSMIVMILEKRKSLKVIKKRNLDLDKGELGATLCILRLASFIHNQRTIL